MRHALLTLLMASTGLMSACSNASNDFVELQAILRPSKVPPDDRIQALLDADAPRLQIAFHKSGLAGVMLLENERDGVRTWLSVDGATISTRDGMVVGERGFGGGMMSSDVSQSLDAVYGGHGTEVTRFHSFLNGESKIELRSYSCTVESLGPEVATIQGKTISTHLFREACGNLDQTFENLYWMDTSSGRMVQARQWLGEYVGSVTTSE